jgi:hypothetical protein
MCTSPPLAYRISGVNSRTPSSEIHTRIMAYALAVIESRSLPTSHAPALRHVNISGMFGCPTSELSPDARAECASNVDKN